MSVLHVAIPQEQERMLNQIAHQEGQSLDALVEQLLQEGIEKRQKSQYSHSRLERLQALARIEEHRQTFLARRNNVPLNIEPTEILDQIREERVQHLFTVLQEHGHDRG
jgi:hypothetical protein